MNLTKFMKDVDSITMDLSHEKLAEFIHYIARKLPENQRTDFLHQLQTSAGYYTAESRIHLTDQTDTDEIRERLLQSQADLQLIEEGELCLSGENNIEYDDWYSIEEEFIFKDPDQVIMLNIWRTLRG